MRKHFEFHAAVAALFATLLGSVALLAGCNLNVSTENRPSSFTSAPLPGGGLSRADAAGAPAAGNATTTRTVEEADIVKEDGAGHVYVVNPYRGLVILDV